MFLRNDDYCNARKLLNYVVNGNLKKVNDFLNSNSNDPAYLCLKSDLTDFNGNRVFYGITPLQYAAWALNISVYERLLTAFKSFELEEEALRQLNELDHEGTTHGRHVAPSSVLDELRYHEYQNLKEGLVYSIKKNI